MKSWIKGGIIGIIAMPFIFPIFSAFFGNLLYPNSDMAGWAWVTLFFLPGSLIFHKMGLNPTKEYSVSGLEAVFDFVFWAICLFLIGALIGWIVGKIKSKK